MNKNDEFLKMLKGREEFLVKEIEKREKRLDKAPAGTLRISKKGKTIQYYIRRQTEKSGTYLKRADQKLILTLAQKKYDERFIRLAKSELKYLRTFVDHYSTQIRGLALPFPWEIKKDMDIAEMTDEEYVHYWQSMEYKPKKIDEGVPFHVTARGERVRSKSEELIANALFSHGIPYKYECPVRLYNGEFRYPDFTILNLRTRKVVLLEHLGMLDDPDYIYANLKKVREYEKSGIFLGKELLITAESQKMPMNTRVINAFITKHFGS